MIKICIWSLQQSSVVSIIIIIPIWGLRIFRLRSNNLPRFTWTVTAKEVVWTKADQSGSLDFELPGNIYHLSSLSNAHWWSPVIEHSILCFSNVLDLRSYILFPIFWVLLDCTIHFVNIQVLCLTYNLLLHY